MWCCFVPSTVLVARLSHVTNMEYMYWTVRYEYGIQILESNTVISFVQCYSFLCTKFENKKTENWNS